MGFFLSLWYLPLCASHSPLSSAAEGGTGRSECAVKHWGMSVGALSWGIPCLNYNTCSHSDTHVRAGVLSDAETSVCLVGLKQTIFSISLFRGKMLPYFQFK